LGDLLFRWTDMHSRSSGLVLAPVAKGMMEAKDTRAMHGDLPRQSPVHPSQQIELNTAEILNSVAFDS